MEINTLIHSSFSNNEALYVIYEINYLNFFVWFLTSCLSKILIFGWFYFLCRNLPGCERQEDLKVDFALLSSNYTQYKCLKGLKWFLKYFSTNLHSHLEYHI